MLAVLIPHKGTVPFLWAKMFRLTLFPERTIILDDTSPSVSIARNRLVKSALDRGADKILFLDIDTVPFVYDGKKLKFDKKWPYLLYEGLEEYDVVSGLYWCKEDTPWTTASVVKRIDELKEEEIPVETIRKLYRWAKEHGARDCHVPVWEIKLGEKMEVDGIGLGLALIKAELFRKIPEPWFAFLTDKGYTVIQGEDGFFCIKVKEVGGRILVDGRVVGQHLVEVAVTDKIRVRWRGNL